MLVERVDEHRVRQVALELGGAAGQDEVAALVGDPLELGQQARLADAGLTDQLDRSRQPGQGSIERAQLLRTSDEGLGELGHTRADPT